MYPDQQSAYQASGRCIKRGPERDGKDHRRSKTGKISLSMKALEEVQEEPVEKVEIPKSENIGTSLGDLFKDLKF